SAARRRPRREAARRRTNEARSTSSADLSKASPKNRRPSMSGQTVARSVADLNLSSRAQDDGLTHRNRSLKVRSMGMLIDGKWHDVWYDTKASQGRVVRSESQFRNWVTRDGAPGPSGRGGFKAEPGRYHLYVSWACPWAHRTLIFRKLKGLEDLI